MPEFFTRKWALGAFVAKNAQRMSVATTGTKNCHFTGAFSQRKDPNC